MLLKRFIWPLACALTFAVPSGAQNIPAQITVRGVTFDSLHKTPLRNATVRIVGRATIAISDERGKFQFDSVQPGRYEFVMQHPELDSIGLPEIVARAEISGASHDVVLFIPSFATLWRRACGTGPAPPDRGFVYGAIRDTVGQNGVNGARVSVSWFDIGLNSAKKLKQTRYTLETRADSLGVYVACGVPSDLPLHIAAWVAPDSVHSPVTSTTLERLAPASDATVDTLSVAALDLPARETRVRRRDLTLVAFSSRATTMTGGIRGVLTTTSGAIMADARVIVDGTDVGRTDSTGRFVQRAVPAGMRTIEFLSIGFKPISRVVEVVADETITVSAQLERVTTLERVDVRATVISDILRHFDERKRMGFGYVQDSTVVSRASITRTALRGFPSTFVRPNKIEFRTAVMGKPFCDANIFVDRQRTVDADILYNLRTDEIAWIEVYPSRFSVPREFMGGGNCGAVVVFTKRSIAR